MASLILAAAAPSHAQVSGDVYQEAVPPPEPYETTNNKAIDRRLDRTEKALRELRAIVLKAQAQGSPVEVKPAGPDPILIDLQQRFGDLQQTVQRLNGQIEQLSFDLEQARRQTAEAQAQIAALTQPPPAPAEPGPVGQEAAPAGPSEAEAYSQARALLDRGDNEAGAAAMQAFLERFPNSSRVPTAHYWRGRALAATGDMTSAVSAFAQSLRGWPTGSWVADATVQMATALAGQKRSADACRVLSEFDGRYAAKASETVKAQAAVTRKAAACR